MYFLSLGVKGLIFILFNSSLSKLPKRMFPYSPLRNSPDPPSWCSKHGELYTQVSFTMLQWQTRSAHHLHPRQCYRCGHCAALLLSWACTCLLVVYLWSCLFKVLSESCIQLRILLITFLRDEGPVQSSRTRHFCWTQIEARGKLIMTRGKKNRTNLNLNHYHIDSTLPLPSSKSTVHSPNLFKTKVLVIGYWEFVNCIQVSSE